jgi:phosphoribosylformylglycinamidine synthase
MESTIQQEATVDQAVKLGLKEEEFEKIKEILGRTPNTSEISIYSVMWSEDCSGKNSILWLKTLPKASNENTGFIQLDEGIGCAIKIEAVDKKQSNGFTMGALPIAQLNALYSGNIDEKSTTQLLRNTIKDIVKHGTALDIPMVGSEVFFDDSFNTSPIAHSFSAGIVDTKKVIPAKAEGSKNPVFIVDIAPDSKKEKLLSEALIELAQTDTVIGIQNIGRGGIACSSCEMSVAGGVGMDIWLDKVSKPQKGVNLSAILTSESQGHLLVIKKFRLFNYYRTGSWRRILCYLHQSHPE